jgi:hypothetical protein
LQLSDGFGIIRPLAERVAAAALKIFEILENLN